MNDKQGYKVEAPLNMPHRESIVDKVKAVVSKSAEELRVHADFLTRLEMVEGPAASRILDLVQTAIDLGYIRPRY